MNNKFHKCEICNSDNWEIIYKGNIRDGSYGNFIEKASIGECLECGVQRLNEKDCMPSEYYDSGKYRKKLQQSLINKKALKEQDHVQKFLIDSVGGLNILRIQVFVDVGCGAGSLLDMTRGIAKKQIGIEPCEPYLNALTGRGYKVYPNISLALEENKRTCDWALSSQVIEHVEDPVKFLKDIYKLLKPGGHAIISTPNLNDILNSILPEFQEFFYRTQHRWYFNKESMVFCAKKSGFEIIEAKFIHRYGLANTFFWLRDRVPKGRTRLEVLNQHSDKLWSAYLENSGQADNLFCHIRRPI